MLDLIKIKLNHFLKKEFIDHFIIYLKKIINQAFDVYLNNLSKINFKVNPSSFNFLDFHLLHYSSSDKERAEGQNNNQNDDCPKIEIFH